VRWTRGKLFQLDQKTRQNNTKAKSESPSLERLYVPRTEGGRGLQSMDSGWEREVVGCVRYLLGCLDPQVLGAMALQQQLRNMGRLSYVAEASEVLAKYDIDVPLSHPLPARTEDAKRLVIRTKEENCTASCLERKSTECMLGRLYGRGKPQASC
jgi:hypothetical protein